MDKEMQAKVDEILKAHGRRELNPDDLDKVVGGGIDMSSLEAIDNYIAAIEIIYNNLGKDVAIAYVLNDCPGQNFKTAMEIDGIAGLRTVLHKYYFDGLGNGFSTGGYN